MRASLIAAAVLSLMGCASVSAGGPSGAGADTCQAEAGKRFIGQQASSEIGAAILAATRSRELRWAAPDTMMTMEYKFGRVTVAYDAGMRITRVSCG